MYKVRNLFNQLDEFLPPMIVKAAFITEVCEGYVFTGVCLSTGGHVRGCRGACMVAWEGGCVVAGGVHGCQGFVRGWGACMVGAGGGMHGCWGGMHGCWGGHAWLPGGMCGCKGVCVVAGGACMGYDEIRRYDQ